MASLSSTLLRPSGLCHRRPGPSGGPSLTPAPQEAEHLRALAAWWPRRRGRPACAHGLCHRRVCLMSFPVVHPACLCILRILPTCRPFCCRVTVTVASGRALAWTCCVFSLFLSPPSPGDPHVLGEHHIRACVQHLRVSQPRDLCESGSFWGEWEGTMAAGGALQGRGVLAGHWRGCPCCGDGADMGTLLGADPATPRCGQQGHKVALTAVVYGGGGGRGLRTQQLGPEQNPRARVGPGSVGNTVQTCVCLCGDCASGSVLRTVQITCPVFIREGVCTCVSVCAQAGVFIYVACVFTRICVYECVSLFAHVRRHLHAHTRGT